MELLKDSLNYIAIGIGINIRILQSGILSSKQLLKCLNAVLYLFPAQKLSVSRQPVHCHHFFSKVCLAAAQNFGTVDSVLIYKPLQKHIQGVTFLDNSLHLLRINRRN